MKQQRGFTLIELLITLAVMAVAAALAAPNIISWMANTRIQQASREILSAFQDARLQAIKANTEAVVLFEEGEGSTGRYSVFVDNGNGGGTAGNGTQDGSEPTISSGRMPAGVRITDAQTGSVAFTSRGFTKDFVTLTVTVRNGRGTTYHVQVIGSGLARIARG